MKLIFSLLLFSVLTPHFPEPLIAVLFPSLALIPDTFVHSTYKKKKRLSEVVLVIHQYLRPWVINFITLYNSSKFHYCFVLNVSFTLEIILFTGYCRMSLFAPYVPTAHFKVNYKKKLKLVKQ